MKTTTNVAGIRMVPAPALPKPAETGPERLGRLPVAIAGPPVKAKRNHKEAALIIFGEALKARRRKLRFGI